MPPQSGDTRGTKTRLPLGIPARVPGSISGFSRSGAEPLRFLTLPLMKPFQAAPLPFLYHFATLVKQSHSPAMRPHLIPVPDGGSLEFHGPPDARRMVVIVGRDAYFEDEGLIARAIAYFCARGLGVAHYESAQAVTQRRITPTQIRAWPRPVRLAVKTLLLVAQPSRWRYFSADPRALATSIPTRARTLAEVIRSLGRERELFLFTRSAGGRLASLVADECGVQRMACLSYPFEHPAEGPDPARYAHLPNLRTPFLIIQGTRDDYGGIGIADKYSLSPHTRLEWAEADHDFRIPETEWPPLLDRVHRFLFDEG